MHLPRNTEDTREINIVGALSGLLGHRRLLVFSAAAAAVEGCLKHTPLFASMTHGTHQSEIIIVIKAHIC